MSRLSLLSPKSRTAGRQTGWIGIDIGTSSLKLAQIARDGDHWTIERSAIVPLPGDVFVSAVAGDQLGESIRAALESGQSFQGKQAACVVGMSACRMRSLDVPNGADGDKRAMVAQELQNDPSAVADELQFEIFETGFPEANAFRETARVNVVSVTRNVGECVARACRVAGLECQVLDAAPFTLARTVAMHSPFEINSVVGVVDWGATGSNFIVTHNGIPIFGRVLRDAAFGCCTDAVKQGLGLTDAECRRLLTNSGVADSISPENANLARLVRQRIGEPLDHLIGELTRTIAFLKNQLADVTPQKLCLVGGGATIHGIAEVIATAVGIPVDVWSLPVETVPSADESTHATSLLASACSLSSLRWQV